MNLPQFYQVVTEMENHGGLQMQAPRGTNRIIYGLARAVNPNIFLDVGAFIGLSSLWVARAMEENGSTGKVYAIELDKHWYDMAIDFTKRAGLIHRINYILGDTLVEIPKLPITQVDFVLLDSGSKRNYVRDFENVEKYLTEESIVLAHDIIEPEKVPFEPAWQFKQYIDTREEYSTFHIKQEYGSLLIRKK